MNYYENIIILDASLDDDTIDGAEKRIVDTIEKNSGEMIKVERWGRRKLAYEINKHEKGFYLFLIFKAPATAIKPLEGLYKVFDPVFKFMVIKLRKKEVEALEESIKAKEIASRAEEPPAEEKVEETQ
ncbi:MAG: 30S ribosomal protein S6 [Nitrospirae bacterium]|nr:30S ribosomal protein S6 [Nitrospirota bacterium]